MNATLPNGSADGSKDGAPLTHAQESLYFLQQLTKGQPVYNMPQAFRLKGALNLEALRKSIAWLVASHDALRTVIVDRDGSPIQIAGAPHEFTFRLHEVSSESDLATKLQIVVTEPFDLLRGPIFRTDLFRLNADDHLLLLNLHHIVGDMSSLGVIFRDLSSAYKSYSLGSEPKVVGKTLQIGEYARLTHAKETSPETVTFWRENLKDATSEPQLALDRFRPKYPSFRGGAYYFELPPGLPEALREFARKNRSSLYMVSLAAFQVLLYRYTGQQKFALSTPFTERDDPSLEDTVGYLISLLPIACDIQPASSFRELLGKVRAQCLAVYSHHDISFRRIIQELGISSESPKPRLASVVFQYFPEMPTFELRELAGEPVQVHTQTSKFDLCVSMAERGGSITTEIEYDSDIFDLSTIQRLAGHFQTLFQGLLTNPDEHISTIDLLNPEEKHRLEQWNQTSTDYPREATVHGLFEEQAKLAPAKIALRFENQEISYAALNERANEIAQQLKKAKVLPGHFVGVCLDRSPDLVATLIGILKTGAAFVPLEATYPKARLEYILEDSGLHVLVTTSKYAHLGHSELQKILLDKLEPAPAGHASSHGSPGCVAYMMYTSGSTGQPKGAVIPHRAIVRLVKNNDFASFSSDQTFLAFAPVSFDASTLEIWGPLLNGGTLAIYPPQFESVEQLEEVLAKHGVTTLWLTAGLFNTVVDRKVEALRGVRQLLIGGDVLSVAHVRKALSALPNTTIINGYGPTENTTFTCCYRVPRELPADRSIPIGTPIRNTTVYILDERMQRVPIGVPGDLYAGGDGLSLGYWNKPELTAASFITNPFSPDERLYKTGDRARYLEGGSIEFLGRRDCQVKIRGYRIEIEEVEAAFRKLENVRDVAIAANAEPSGDKILIAYVVLRNGSNTSPAHLLSELGKLLPAYSCPSRIVLLPELPLGPNGKVNRSALPAPGELPVQETEATGPSSDIEEKLIQLWKQILEVRTVGIDDNFFHLGGESLRATRAISQINATFNCRLTLPRLFEAPTVRQLARIVENARDDSVELPLPTRPGVRFDSITDVSSLSDKDVDALLTQLLDDSRKY